MGSKENVANISWRYDDSLFKIISVGRKIPLADSAGRKHLKKMSSLLNTPSTLHSLRRAGTTWGFQYGVSLAGPDATWNKVVRCQVDLFIYLFIRGFTLLSTLCRSYHDE